MSEEQPFLDALADRPEDRAVRLVYADWLEERGDRRAELVRIEEEMRRVAVHSDRFWELKPRRNELREACDEEWLAAMKYGTDYEPVFRDVPNGWRERWRLLREFTERWHGLPMGDVGGRTEEVQGFEKRVGRTLPPSVREWVAYALDLEDQSKFGRVLRDDFVVKDVPELGAVALMIQGEGDFCYAVGVGDLGAPDPPVLGYALDYEAGEGPRFAPSGPRPFAPHVTTFAFRHASFFLHGAGGGLDAEVNSTTEFLRQLADAFPVRSQFDHLHVFEATNLIVLLGPSAYAGDEVRLSIDVWKRLTKEQVPPVLWQFAPPGSAFHGMFLPGAGP